MVAAHSFACTTDQAVVIAHATLATHCLELFALRSIIVLPIMADVINIVFLMDLGSRIACVMLDTIAPVALALQSIIALLTTVDVAKIASTICQG